MSTQNDGTPFSRQSGSQGERPSLVQFANAWKVGGYQEYTLQLTKRGGGIRALRRRTQAKMIDNSLSIVGRGQTLTDLGCSAGFHGLNALLHGQKHVTFVDHDEEYLEVVRKVIEVLDLSERSRILSSKVSDAHELDSPESEICLAIALIHWLWSSTETFQSLAIIIEKLARFGSRSLIVEWVPPNDSAVQSFKHLERVGARLSNSTECSSPQTYDLPTFKRALKGHYRYVYQVGKTSKSRTLFLATNDRLSLVRRLRLALAGTLIAAAGAEAIRRRSKAVVQSVRGRRYSDI